MGRSADGLLHKQPRQCYIVAGSESFKETQGLLRLSLFMVFVCPVVWLRSAHYVAVLWEPIACCGPGEGDVNWLLWQWEPLAVCATPGFDCGPALLSDPLCSRVGSKRKLSSVADQNRFQKRPRQRSSFAGPRASRYSGVSVQISCQCSVLPAALSPSAACFILLLPWATWGR